MNLEKYEVSYDEARENFKFISVGDNGSIVKVVSYQKITDGLFNLAFGDWDDGKMKINDRTRSNNGDRQRYWQLWQRRSWIFFTIIPGQ